MSDDALFPLRLAYGVQVPGSDAAGAARGAAARTEAALLAQTRTAIEAAVAGADRQPPSDVLAAVLTRAAEASDAALAPLGAVRSLYNLPAGAVHPAEAALLSQSRAAVESTFGARTLAPSAAALAAITARAAEATRFSPAADAAVAVPALAPLAVAYGLPLSAEMGAPSASETALLVQTRALLDGRPAAAGPSEAAIAAVLARAASFAAPVTPVIERAAAAPPAADRSPVHAARRVRRAGAWASAAAVAVALVFALMPRPAGAPELTPAAEEQLVASALSPDVSTSDAAPAAAPTEEETTPEALVADPSPLLAVVPPPPAPAVAAAPRAIAPDPSPAAAPAVAPVADTRRAPATPRTPALQPPPPDVPARPAPVSRTADPTTTLASADATPSAEGAWEAPANVRVLSLRLQALGRGTADLGWDAPAEAFGAPAASALSTPGLRSVRETVPAARARLFTVPGDR